MTKLEKEKLIAIVLFIVFIIVFVSTLILVGTTHQLSTVMLPVHNNTNKNLYIYVYHGKKLYTSMLLKPEERSWIEAVDKNVNLYLKTDQGQWIIVGEINMYKTVVDNQIGIWKLKDTIRP